MVKDVPWKRVEEPSLLMVCVQCGKISGQWFNYGNTPSIQVVAFVKPIASGIIIYSSVYPRTARRRRSYPVGGKQGTCTGLLMLTPCHPERSASVAEGTPRPQQLPQATASHQKNWFVKGFSLVGFCSVRGDPSTSLHSSLCSLFSYAQDDRHRSN